MQSLLYSLTSGPGVPSNQQKPFSKTPPTCSETVQLLSCKKTRIIITDLKHWRVILGQGNSLGIETLKWFSKFWYRVCLQCFTEAELVSHHNGIEPEQERRSYLLLRQASLWDLMRLQLSSGTLQKGNIIIGSPHKVKSIHLAYFQVEKTYQQLFRLGRYESHHRNGPKKFCIQITYPRLRW